TAEIDCRRSILVVPPGSGRSAYQSAAGPVCTGWYRYYRSMSKSHFDESCLVLPSRTVIIDRIL
ncbi:hypothetical protein GW17_00013154, partial [Ensete ventricosum]